jgi:hypothetical protein
MSSGQWAVGSGQWAVGSGQWAVGSGQWAVAERVFGKVVSWCDAESVKDNSRGQSAKRVAAGSHPKTNHDPERVDIV